ncbi:MAG: hypothetical protein LDL01_06195, partial [Ignavibacterium sp.]|nr:hypothetical protein [Ignavibacterium sp.]
MIILLTFIGFYQFSIVIYAQENIDSLIALQSQKDGKERISLLIKIGYYLSSDNPKEAIQYLDEAISLSEKLNLQGRKAD